MLIDLTTRAWQLAGWRPYGWKFNQSMETGQTCDAHIPPMPAKVPGSVQAALRDAGLIPDWNIGLNSLDCEWVEHRHWDFFVTINQGEITPGQPVVLHAGGLDYSGWILIDGRVAATFSGALIRYRFDLTSQLGDGKAHELRIIFDEPPREQGQVGFTSQSRYFKPRFSYSWDWCPRLVTIGIWDRLWLEAGQPPARVVKVSAGLGENLRDGRVSVWLDEIIADVTAVITLRFDGRPAATCRQLISDKSACLTLRSKDVKPWWPNAEGEQPLYELSVVIEQDDATQQIHTENIGFKRIRWLPCEGASADAEPWICEINGRPIFLQGVNWTPPRLDYHSVTDEDYAKLINLYREMGCNLLRVWGGGYLERQEFYDLCDRAGILVWQEFPLSSSGPENYAPEDPTVIADLCDIAREFIRRRGHHVCKLLWCGGNELQSSEKGGKTGIGVPLDLSHPCLAMLNEVVKTEDPGTRFLPTSASGPKFMAAKEDFGKGVHHDVHGPWRVDGSIENWRTYWAKDDALFRSETGSPAASSIELIDRYRGNCNPWPPQQGNPYWMHTAAWWIQWDAFEGAVKDLPENKRFKKYVQLSQNLQAISLSIAASACKARFPKCGGILIWMGHDCFPCAANTSIIQFDLEPKPAYFALAKVFTRER